MRKINSILFLFLLMICSCGDNEMEFCEDLLMEIDNKTISGTISICNAMPPQQDFIDGEADILIVGDSIRFDVRALDNSFDTTLVFKYECNVYEGSIASIEFVKDNKEGIINNLSSFFIPFSLICEVDNFSNY